jgi:hypothetical protein
VKGANVERSQEHEKALKEAFYFQQLAGFEQLVLELGAKQVVSDMQPAVRHRLQVAMDNYFNQEEVVE